MVQIGTLYSTKGFDMVHTIVLQGPEGMGDNSVTTDAVIGRLGFVARDPDGTYATLVVGKIEAVAEEAFTASENQTKMVFYLAADGTAASKMTLSSAGLLTPAGGITSTAAANTFGATSFSDANITNVGSLACGSMVVDTAAAGLDIVFGGVTTTNTMTLTDSLADALNITEGSNSYMKFDTSSEKIIISKTLYSATDGDITIKAEGDMVVQVDADGDTSESFSWLNGAGLERMNLTEGGHLQVDGDLDLGARYIGTTKAYTAQSGSVAIDATKANYFTVITNGAITGLDIQNAVLGQKLVIRFAWGGSDTLAYASTTVIWPGGTAPTNTSTGVDVYGYICTTASSNFDGYVIGQNLS